MKTVSIEQAKSQLDDLIHQLAPGEEVVISEHGQPVARLVPAAARTGRRQLGTMQGSVQHMAGDFDAPLDDFSEYMP